MGAGGENVTLFIGGDRQLPCNKVKGTNLHTLRMSPCHVEPSATLFTVFGRDEFSEESDVPVKR